MLRYTKIAWNPAQPRSTPLYLSTTNTTTTMGRLSNAQIKYRNAGRKGGRGNRRVSPIPIKAPQQSKTTACWYKRHAALAEQALHLAALANIRLSALETQSTATSNNDYLSSSSSQYSTKNNSIATAMGSAANSSDSTTRNMAGRVDCRRNSDAAARQFISEDTQAIIDTAEDFEDFEDWDEMELGVEPIVTGIEEGPVTEFQYAVQHWPRAGTRILKKRILENGKFIYH